MKIAVVGNSPNWYFDQLSLVAGDRHQLTFVGWDRLLSRLGDQERVMIVDGVESDDFDTVLVRGMPRGSLEQVIFRMNALARWQAIGMSIVNSPKSLEAAIDKYLALALMQSAGLPVPETLVCQSVPEALDGFDKLGRDVVIKPVFGGEGRGLVRVTDPELALRAFRTVVNLQNVVYMQKFIEHGNVDTRLLVVGDQVLGMRRQNPDDWRSNVSRGATCEAFRPNDDQIQLAKQAVDSIGAEIAGIDVVENRKGRSFVLEINGIPGWKAIDRCHDVCVARLVLDYLCDRGESNSA